MDPNPLNVYKVMDKILPGGWAPPTGGRTKCKHCNCLISNEDFDSYKSTNKKCNCGHYYYDHDLFL